MNPDFIEELAPELQPLLLRPKAERERLLDQTRRHIDSSGFTNPFNWVYSKVEAPGVVDRKPTFEGARPQDAEAFRSMGFVPLHVLKAAGVEFERWAGPDGAVSLECLGKKYFMSALFEDGYKVVVAIDDAIGRQVAAKNPKAGYIYSSGDPRDDYVTILQQVHAYTTRLGVEPLYRFDSAEVDLALYHHYLRNFATLSTIKTSVQSKAIDVLLGEEGMKEVGSELAEIARKAKSAAFSGSTFAQIDSTGVVVECPDCRQRNRIAFERLGDAARCAACGEQFEATARLGRFNTCDHFVELVRASPIPIVTGFSYPAVGDLSEHEHALVSVKFGLHDAGLVRVKNGDYGHAEIRRGDWDRRVAVGFVAR